METLFKGVIHFWCLGRIAISNFELTVAKFRYDNLEYTTINPPEFFF